MCKSAKADPLVREFMDRYQINLLSIPRAGAQIGDVYVHHKSAGISKPGQLNHLLDAAIELPPRSVEHMASLAGRLTSAFELQLGLGFLQGALGALGLAAIAGKIEASYQRAFTRRLRFRFDNMLRESVDPHALGRAIQARTIDRRHPSFAEKNRYYLTTAVIRSKDITVIAEDDRSTKLDLDVGMDELGLDAGFEIDRTGKGELTYKAPRAIAFGVELDELALDAEENRFTMQPLTTAVAVRLARRPQRPGAVLLAGDDDPLVTLPDGA